MLDRDLLLAARPVPLECFHLCHICPRELVIGTLGTFKLLGADKIDIQRQLKANGLEMFD